MAVYSNISGKKSVRAALLKYSQGITNLNIASAFFSSERDLIEISKRGVAINIIVRLGEGTSVQSLKELLKHKRINVRYYTDSKFHPKIYVFGDKLALVGSANATNSGLNSNSEVSVVVEQKDEDFDEIVSLFALYWENALPLTAEKLSEVEAVLKKYSTTKKSIESDIEKRLGKTSPPSDVIVDKIKKTKHQTYIEDYERSYQIFKSAYDVIYEIYIKHGKRKPEARNLPIRIEIDQLWNYIREELTRGDSYNIQPVRTGAELERFTISVIEKWIVADFPYLEKVIKNYALISDSFSSVEKIRSLSIEEIFEALMVCHAFQESMRYIGTREVAKDVFISGSNEEQLKECISYLLYDDKDRFVHRMAECIFGPYKVDYLARYSIQELLGWVNDNEIPICNQRTMRALRHLGAVEGNY